MSTRGTRTPPLRSTHPAAAGARAPRGASGGARADGDWLQPGPPYAPGWSLGRRLPPAAAPAHAHHPRTAPDQPPPDAGPDAGPDGVPAGRVLRRRRARRGPRPQRGPSRLSYRLNRLWLTPLVRRMLTVGLPVFVISLSVGVVMSDPARQAAAHAALVDAYDSVIDRPEFRVEGVRVLGDVSAEVHAAALGRVDVTFPESSFRIDMAALRRELETIDAIRSADLRLGGDRMLELRLVERSPAVIWRHRGGLELLDGEGRRIARLTERASRADLPLLAGAGAEQEVPEALRILDAAAPLDERIRGLVRVGERRWDLVLDRDQRIALPETAPIRAIERVLALDGAQDLLARDTVLVDLRLHDRPTLRLSDGALETFQSIRHSPE